MKKYIFLNEAPQPQSGTPKEQVLSLVSTLLNKTQNSSPDIKAKLFDKLSNYLVSNAQSLEPNGFKQAFSADIKAAKQPQQQTPQQNSQSQQPVPSLQDLAGQEIAQQNAQQVNWQPTASNALAVDPYINQQQYTQGLPQFPEQQPQQQAEPEPYFDPQTAYAPVPQQAQKKPSVLSKLRQSLGAKKAPKKKAEDLPMKLSSLMGGKEKQPDWNSQANKYRQGMINKYKNK